MATLVPSPILTSKKSNDPHDPNMIGANAVKLLNQSQVDTHYDPIPEKRVGESFCDFSTPNMAITFGTIGILLIIMGFIRK